MYYEVLNQSKSFRPSDAFHSFSFDADSMPSCLANQVQDIGYFDAFIPECNENGDYKPLQCDYRNGYCWCSDKNGNPIPGTTVRGRANCTAPGTHLLKEISRLK